MFSATLDRTGLEAHLVCMHDLATLHYLNTRASETCVRCGVARESAPLTLYEAITADRIGNPVLLCDDCQVCLCEAGRALHRVRS